MKLIVCLDDKNGMAFNRRRQTRDRKQRIHMYDLIDGSKLYVAPYSEKLLKDEFGDLLVVDKNYLELAGEEDFVLAETDDVSSFINRADMIVVYRWNRSYLSDVVFPADVLEEYELKSSVYFSGTSHDVITCEVYER